MSNLSLHNVIFNVPFSNICKEGNDKRHVGDIIRDQLKTEERMKIKKDIRRRKRIVKPRSINEADELDTLDFI